jgi:hypothetical protein
VRIVSGAVIDIESKGRIVQVVRTGNLDQRAGTATSTARNPDLRTGHIKLGGVRVAPSSVQSNMLNADEI